MSKRKSKKENQNKKNVLKNENPLGVGFFVIPIILLIFAFALILSIMQDKSYIYVSPVMKNYEPLEKSKEDAPEEYFIDELGLFYDKERHYLINGSAEYLYEKTGVRVFLYAMVLDEDESGNRIVPTDKEAEEACKAIYNKVSEMSFDVVLIFAPTVTGFESWTYASDEVKEEFGNKFERILQQYVNYNFHVVGEYDELFYFSYRNTADRIMGGFTSPFKLVAENLRVFLLTLITLVIVVPSIIIYRRMGKRNKR